MARVFISLGSNIQKEQNLVAALLHLRARCTLVAVSSFYETLPVGDTTKPNYYNAAALLETELSAHPLKHEVLRQIEQELGRVRTSDPYTPRPIDLDLVLYEDHIFELDGKPIPHPDILTCAYVAVPLAEIDPTFLHPVTGQSLQRISEELAGTGAILQRIEANLP